VLGVGTGHREQFGDRFTKPYSALIAYLDELDEHHVPANRRLLAALGPKVLALAAERSLGAHPYLTTPEHTGQARKLLGTTALLAPEQKVVLDPDPERARSLGRPLVRTPYLSLVNYTNNLRRLGYTDHDLADGGSDRLIDDLVAHGDIATVAARLHQHLAAGADHVAIQLISPDGADPVEGYRRLAGELLG
jgi:probable F420-dependent oxidoreductase